MVVSGWRGELGAAIRQARVAAGLSQGRLAAVVGVRQSSVSQWERGVTAPQTWHLLGLLRELGGHLARLLLGEQEPAGAGMVRVVAAGDEDGPALALLGGPGSRASRDRR